MYVITYSLRGEDADSDQFYTDVATFTDEILAEIDGLASKHILGYRDYMKQSGLVHELAVDEMRFEFLVLGILWKVYSGDAKALDAAPKQMLTLLSEMREQANSLKPSIDFMRGVLSTLFLSPDLYDHLFTLDPNLMNMDKLMAWLEATGEFKYEVMQLRRWYSYLETLPPQAVSELLATAITLAMWFSVRSEQQIGRYTGNVERYLNELRPKRYWREDVIFCGRRRVEYHMNMVGAEVMNRAFRDAFCHTEKKVVVLPACMRLLPQSKCKAESFRCKRCVAECYVQQISKMGDEHGFEVYIIPHESSLSAGRDDQNALLQNGAGVVGIACVLNLISGGWMLKKMGVAAQCVLLDYCGCKNHWSDEGFPTQINLKQLNKILGIEMDRRG